MVTVGVVIVAVVGVADHYKPFAAAGDVIVAVEDILQPFAT